MKILPSSLIKYPFLRNTLIAFLAIAALIPLYERLRSFPAFRHLLILAAEDQAVRVASHLSAYAPFRESTLNNANAVPESWIEEVIMVSRDLQLEKVKVFSKTGEVIYSTDKTDTGKINKHSYFHEIVTSGKVYSKVVEKDARSLDGVLQKKTVVETYVPIMRNSRFVGSFEIYYNIASQHDALNRLLGRLQLDMILMALGLTILAVILVSRAARAMRAHEVSVETLRLSEERFRCISESAKDAIVMVDPEGKVSLWNGAATTLFGYTETEAMGGDMHRMLAPDRFIKSAEKGFSLFTRTGKGDKVVGHTIEMVARRKSGEEFPVEVSVSAIEFRGGWNAIGILRDISQRKAAEQKLKLGMSVMENAADAILVTNNRGIIEMVNPAFTQVTGYNPEEAIGKNPKMLKSGRHDASFYRQMWGELADSGIWRGEIWNRRKDGALYPQQLAMSAIYDAERNVSHYVAVFNDISQRKADEENLERLAFYDPLTGIPNRLLFHERLDRALREDRRYKTSTALLFMDLDHFKQVNDRFGHDVGDLLLQESAQRILKLVRDEDTVARLGGDEFTVILRRASQPKDATRIAGNIIAALTKPFFIKDHECRIGSSIGIALHPVNALDVDTLIKRADEAMYIAKKGGRNRFHICREAMENAADAASQI